MGISDVTIFGAGRPEAGGRTGDRPMDRRGYDQLRREAAAPGTLLIHGYRVGTAVAAFSCRRAGPRVSSRLSVAGTLDVAASAKMGISEGTESLAIPRFVHPSAARQHGTIEQPRTDSKRPNSAPDASSRIGSRLTADSNGIARLPILGDGTENQLDSRTPMDF
jgi:hypothetical protein